MSLSEFFSSAKLPFLVLFILLSDILPGQNVIWSEDFSDALNDWRIQPANCGAIPEGLSYGNNAGPETGVWELSGGTINGELIDFPEGSIFEWSFLNEIEYALQIEIAGSGEYGTVYGRYSIDENQLFSTSITQEDINTNGIFFEEQTTNGIVNWAVNLNFIDLNTFLPLIGIGTPLLEIAEDGTSFTYQTIDGSSNLEFTKRADCGTQWLWSPNGNLGYGISGLEPGEAIVDSDTRSNGVMTMNNLFQMTLGDPAVFPNPNIGPYPSYTSELISPAIDITAVELPLSLTLTQYLAYLNAAPDAPEGLKTSFAISIDDGVTWSPPLDLNPGLGTNEISSETITVPIPVEYYQGATQMSVKFTFATDFYVWGIDDIAIQEREAYDMQVNADYIAIPENVMTPYSQLQPQYFMAEIQNNGGRTAENVQLDLTIIKEASEEEVYFQSKNYGNLSPDSVLSNDILNTTEPFVLEATPVSAGAYQGTYQLTQDSIESNNENNFADFSFWITDTLFAKETGRTRPLRPAEGNSWYIGNSFYITNADGEDSYARYISFMLDNASAVVNGAGFVNTLLFETDGDTNEDGRIAPEEYGFGPIAVNQYMMTGTEDQELITIPVSDQEEGIPLQAGKYYLVVVQYKGEDENDILELSASDEFNYEATGYLSELTGIVQYSDVAVVTAEEQPSFFTDGFPGTVIPVIRLSIGERILTTTTGPQSLPLDYQSHIYPNPAQDILNINIDFPSPLGIKWQLSDEEGRVMLSGADDNLTNREFSLDLSHFSSGAYYLQLITPLGNRTREVVIQR